MQISKSAGYAVHGLGYLISRESENPIQVSEIAEDQDISRTYLAKIFQQLSTAGIVVGHRGVTGGYVLARDPKDITLVDVVEAVDGPILRKHCCLGLFNCPIKNKCIVLDTFSKATEVYIEYLKTITLDEIVTRMKEVNAPFMAYPAGSKPTRDQ